MPYLIDGNNLVFALRAAGYDRGRTGLCQLLAAMAGRDKATVVFDGPLPPHGLLMQMEHPNLALEFSSPQSADSLLIGHINACSAPKLLTVVSSDHEIQQAARHRKCRVRRSEDFVPELLEAASPLQPHKPAEPPQKRQGLSEEESERWIREFNLDEEPDEPEKPKT